MKAVKEKSTVNGKTAVKEKPVVKNHGEVVPQRALAQIENFLQFRKATELDSPIRYSHTLGVLIGELIVMGLTIDQISERDDMPSASQIHGWARRYPEFTDIYQSARQRLADILVAKAQQIADDGSNDFKKDSKGRTIPDWENVNRSKLRVETYKWRASKLAPKAYGDKLEISDGTALSDAETPQQRLLRFKEIVDEYVSRGGDRTAMMVYLGLLPTPEAD